MLANDPRLPSLQFPPTAGLLSTVKGPRRISPVLEMARQSAAARRPSACKAETGQSQVAVLCINSSLRPVLAFGALEKSLTIGRSLAGSWHGRMRCCGPNSATSAHNSQEYEELERKLITERTRAGIQAAKHRGVKFGRKPKLTPQQIAHARKMLAEGEPVESVLGVFDEVCRSTLYRNLAA